jgi:hypothetical protein
MLGAAILLDGKIEYYNWWSGTIFAPFEIIIGSLGLVIAACKPEILFGTAKKEKPLPWLDVSWTKRPRGRAPATKGDTSIPTAKAAFVAHTSDPFSGTDGISPNAETPVLTFI